MGGCIAPTHNTDPLASKVDTLLGQATQSGTEAKAFAELEALGTDAVPYLVGHLSDMRQLPKSEIELNNNADGAFEGIRHYSPSVVHDALAAILNQLTGQNFVVVYNGASLADRQSNTALWQQWCVRNYPSKSPTCLGQAQAR
ncbi:hypothetical protein DYGSA30_14500 [Dyella sp. GSA-30]|nr:hypothetical protein DYGSA30_14500 [Dyella sp. GSA-30]